jgi:NadR type nicotinamide-nucleotide adenylyltransferase
VSGRTGLIIGKFLPPHRGHLHLIEQARAQVHQLTVAVFSRPDEPIPGPLRAAWLAELCPGVRVLHSDDPNPQWPHEHPAFWDIWTASVRRLLPTGPDLVFSSEDYGDELALWLGARHVLVDHERRAFPISGTRVRADPLGCWEFLPPPVRAHHAVRVVVTGPESTGKTTLASDLAAHYGTVWVPEFARPYLDRKNAHGLPPSGLMVEPSDLQPIADGQTGSEDVLARRANRVLLCDTDVTTTCVYARHYLDLVPPAIDAESRRRRYALHLLLGVDVPWVPDPQRDRPGLRGEMYALFREALVERGHRFVEVCGSWEQRRARAIEAIDAVLLGDRLSG